MKIVLGSASPRRKELLEQIGLEFRIVVSDAEENIRETVPHRIVEELSCIKAQAVLDSLDTEEEVLVIGADTIVALGDEILGKPKDRDDALRMIEMLQGNVHEVYTGVTLLHRERAKDGGAVTRNTFHEMTKVSFYSMSPAEVEGYVDTPNPVKCDGVSKWNPDSVPFECEDKAGAYGIQGGCARYISGIEGDYNNVVGLPVGRLYQEAKKSGWLK